MSGLLLSSCSFQSHSHDLETDQTFEVMKRIQKLRVSAEQINRYDTIACHCISLLDNCKMIDDDG
eukprot:scaffold15824_cov155-Skeletonema_menzelii.AAC.4